MNFFIKQKTKSITGNYFGFSLIELLITIAMIGILATLSITRYEITRRKSQQSEAKLYLGGIYALEKNFYSEYSSYAPGLDAIGFVPEGNRRFYLSTICWTHTGANYTGTITGYTGTFDIQYYDFLNNPFSDATAVINGDCTGLFGGGACNVHYPALDPQSFSAFAKGILCSSCGRDVWGIDETKRLANCSIGTK